MRLVGLVGAGASVLVVWLLLEHGTSGVAGICDPGETNYTDTIVRLWYSVQENQTKLERTFETRCCPGHSRENASVPCVQMGCLNGTFGENCTETCSCPENAHQNCDQKTGQCMCLPGWNGTDCTEALGSSQGDGTTFDESLTYYIVAAAGAFLAIVLAISIVVFLKHRRIGKRGKPSLCVNTHEIEMPNKEPANADNAIDSQQKQVPSTEETDTSIAMQPDDDVCETECSPGKDDEEDDYDETDDAMVDIDETFPAVETAEETFPDDEEHYVDMENERCAASKSLRSETVQIDDEHNGDYDTYDALNNRKKEVSKPDDSYDKFNVNKKCK